MKLTNFKISSFNIAFETTDYYLDLHNNYGFISFEYKVKDRQFQISWSKSIGGWVDEKLPKKLNLNFINTSFLKIKENEASEFIADDSCLDAIGFADINMRDDMISWLAKPEENNDYDLLLIFYNGQTVKINAEIAQLEILND